MFYCRVVLYYVRICVRFSSESSWIVQAALQDAELIRYFKEIENMPADDKEALVRVIAAFIRDVKTKQAYAK